VGPGLETSLDVLMEKDSNQYRRQNQNSLPRLSFLQRAIPDKLNIGNTIKIKRR